MKNFTDLFLKRPVLASSISILIFVAGLFSIFHLPLRLLPKVTDPVISITTTYPGASSKTMQGFVTSTIASALSGVKGAAYISSNSSQGLSIVNVHMQLGSSPQKALSTVLSKVSSVSALLPTDANKPSIKVGSSNGNPLMILAFSSDSLKRRAVADYLRRSIAPQLNAVDGVAEAKVLGRSYAMRLWLNPLKMAARGVTAGDVAKAIKSNNVQTAAGKTKGKEISFNVQATTNLHNAKQFNNILIKSNNGAYVRLKDIGEAKLGDQDKAISAFYNGKPATMVFIEPLPGANPVTVSQDIKKKLAIIKNMLPSAISVHVVVNAGRYIHASIQELARSLIEAAIIVILVIFLFLGSLRSVLIPVITIPLSLVGVCALLLMLAYSINTLTLLALVLAIGLVVDDAIVVVENIYRHIESGASVFAAATQGAREILYPVIAMSLTLAVVFVPIGLSGGLTGQLFAEFAFTLSACVILSGIIALTLSPMLASKVLQPMKTTIKNNKPSHYFKVGYDKVCHAYFQGLDWTLHHRKKILSLWGIILVMLVLLLIYTPKMLAPNEDQGLLMALTSAPNSTGVNFLNNNVETLANVYKKFDDSNGQVVVSGIPSSHKAISFISLKSWDERKKSSMKIQPELQSAVNDIAGVQTVVFNPPSLPGSSGLPIQVVLKSTLSFKDLYKMSNVIIQKAWASGKFAFVQSNLEYNQPVLKLEINRNAATVLGISMSEISDTLNLMLGGNHIQQFSKGGESYYVIPQVQDKFRLNPLKLYKIHLKTASGELVPLASIAKISTVVEPKSLYQFQKMNAVKLSAEMAPNYTIADGIAFLTKTARTLFPHKLMVSYSGQSRQFIEEGDKIFWLILAAVLGIFLLIAIQFESFSAPLIILFGSAPLAIFGAMVVLFAGFGSLNIYTEIALLTLVGLVSKHGILIIDFANDIRLQGSSKLEAIKKAVSKRFRPILMTTAAMVFGAIPLVLATGAGSVAKTQLGIVIVCGMLVGTFLTLFILPNLYMVLAPNKIIQHDDTNIIRM